MSAARVSAVLVLGLVIAIGVVIGVCVNPIVGGILAVQGFAKVFSPHTSHPNGNRRHG